MKTPTYYAPILIVLLLIGVFASCENTSEAPSSTETERDTIAWQPFTPDVFAQAKEEQKLVLLDVGANWCHWCHVMDDSTYSDSEVIQYLNENFILTREDQDSRPDLYATYKTWGWPAIIVLNEEGEDLKRMKGYQPRKHFLNTLKEVQKSPTPITDTQKEERKPFATNSDTLFTDFISRLDHEKGGYHWNNKFISLPGFLHGLQYYQKSEQLKNWTDITLRNSFQLVDPVWSGVYQYSARESWDHQHYEKLLRVQANYIHAYSRYAAVTGDSTALNKAIGIFGYCQRFFGTEESTLFYNSQNADLIAGVHSETYYRQDEPERLERGIPSVDEKIYLKENVQLAISLVELWAATDELTYLDKSMAMADEILDLYPTEKGIYKRDLRNTTIFSFSDNRYLLDLLLQLYEVTSQKQYLTQAEKLGHALVDQFSTEEGFVSTIGALAKPAGCVPLDNIRAVMSYEKLAALTDNTYFSEVALNAYERTDKVALLDRDGYLPLLIQAEEWINKDVFHAVFISDGTDHAQHYSYYKKVCQSGRKPIVFESLTDTEMTAEENLIYGDFPSGTVFLCTDTYCSAPISEINDFVSFLDGL